MGKHNQVCFVLYLQRYVYLNHHESCNYMQISQKYITLCLLCYICQKKIERYISKNKYLIFEIYVFTVIVIEKYNHVCLFVYIRTYEHLITANHVITCNYCKSMYNFVFVLLYASKTDTDIYIANFFKYPKNRAFQHCFFCYCR